MTIRVAINGFGRIGRVIARILAANYNPNVELVAINGRSATKMHYHLMKYDSVHGVFQGKLEYTDDALIINGKKIKFFHEADPENIAWKSLDVDVVFECTGAFKDKDSASKHLKAGAKKVLISAPVGSDIKTIIYGVNDHHLEKDDKIISVGSCTTNCLAPIADILHKNFKIVKGFMTSIHSFTNDQNTIDARHKDLCRARAASLSIIPTSTGAAKAIARAIPDLEGKIDGVAVRVPTANVSLVDLCFLSEKKTTISELNDLVKKEAQNSKILAYEYEPQVSIDFCGRSESSIFDSNATKIVADDFIRIASWYDNEWGFSCRMIDVATLIMQ